MQLQFKQQQFQVNAVKAIVECFAGQPKETARFTLERSAELIRKAKLAATSEGKLLDVEEEIAESIGICRRGVVMQLGYHCRPRRESGRYSVHY